MPRYFFHINDSRQHPDDDGTVLDDAEAAHAQAIMTAGAMLSERDDRRSDDLEWHMTVIDEVGQPVCELHFSAHCPD
jgi:hypothetical protein